MLLTGTVRKDGWMELVDVVGVAAAQVGVGQRRYGRIVGAGHRTGRLDVAHVRRIVVADGAASAAASVAQRRSVRRPIVALARPQHHVLIGRICAKQEKLNQQQTQHQSPPAHSNPIPPPPPSPGVVGTLLGFIAPASKRPIKRFIYASFQTGMDMVTNPSVSLLNIFRTDGFEAS